ncbi:hypothetical protein lerEdw1_014363 [Lerista edwardsae]|nr:hypothetical protein lerEdw1_014363 [Lerista edwardsae]
MAGLMRDSCLHQHRRPSRKICTRMLAEYIPVGMPPQSLLDQLVCDMQRHLEEMERVRTVLQDAYPSLASSAAAACPRPIGGARGPRGPRKLSLDYDDSDDTSNYQFSVDVPGYAPEELSVKLEGRKVTVCGKRDQKTEAADGCVSRDYREVRKELRLPPDANLDAVTCMFSPEAGCLCIEAPRMAPPTSPERTIPISVHKPADVPAVGAAAVASLPPAKEAPPATPEAAAAPAA